MTSLLAIANDDAGTSTDELVEEVLGVLRTAAEVDLVATSTPEDLGKALSDHPDVDGVVVLGGDGSLHAVVAALHEAGRLPGTVVGLVPLGTGNDFGRTLALPEDPCDAARVVVRGTVRDIDLAFTADGEVVVNAVHVGIGAEAAAAARPWKKVLGKVGYAVGALISGLSEPSADVEVTIDGQVLPRRGPVAQVAVGNGRYVGGGSPLLPTADPSDGLLDVAVSYASSLRRRLAYGWHLRRGVHPHSDDVVYRQGTTVTVSGEALRATNDGELTPRATTHTWEIEPGAMRMYVP